VQHLEEAVLFSESAVELDDLDADDLQSPDELFELLHEVLEDAIDVDEVAHDVLDDFFVFVVADEHVDGVARAVLGDESEQLFVDEAAVVGEVQRVEFLALFAEGAVENADLMDALRVGDAVLFELFEAQLLFASVRLLLVLCSRSCFRRR